MKRFLPVLILCAVFYSESQAQLTRFIIRFKHKGATSFTLANPSAYLSTRALERRTRYGIAIDSSDLPVPSSYVSQISSIPGVVVLNSSRWLNAITIDTTNINALNSINALPFVQSSTAIASKNISSGKAKFEDEILINPLDGGHKVKGTEADYFNYGTSSYNEIHLHKGEFLHNIGLRGQNMHIAMLDAGFFNYTTLDAFDSVVANGQVLSTWDFVNRESSVVEDNSHGMMCFSTIAANIPGQFVGKAPKASFHLFKTEDVTSEYPIEEFNWVCGAERADSAGANLVSSSLGYNTFDNPSFNYSYAQMNGNTAMCTIGADIAVKKGILVVNAVGNEGTSSWHSLIAPSDGDSVLAVGAVSATGTIWPGSGYGPSSDNQIKPDVASIGLSAVVQGTGNSVGVGTGTSFACPNMAGLATCLWQGFPEYNNMRIVRALRDAGSIASSPNDRIGYGIPDMKLAFSTLLVEYATSTASVAGCNSTINWSSKDMGAMRYEIERKIPGETVYTKVGEISATAGDILANRNYTFANALVNVNAGIVSYRIRQIIDTASASFSAVYIDTANVNLGVACTTTATIDPSAAGYLIKVVPNPSNAVSSLQIETPQAIARLTILVFDAEGRLVLQLLKSKQAGKVNIPISSRKLGAGKYFMNIYDGSKLIGIAEMLKL